jgi:hypothetical protein
MEEQTGVRYVENWPSRNLYKTWLVQDTYMAENQKMQILKLNSAVIRIFLTVKEFMILLLALLQNYWSGMICNNLIPDLFL